MRRLTLYSLILTGIISTIISCSKSGGDTPVQPPKDTTTTQPPNDTTSTGTDTSGTGAQDKHYIAMTPLFNTMINIGNDKYVEQLDNGGTGTDGKTNYIRTDTRLGSYVGQRFLNPGNQMPLLSTATSGDILLGYPNMTTSTAQNYYTNTISDTAKYLNIQFTIGDTTYVVFPIGPMRLRGYTGSVSQCDSVLRVIGNTPSALDGKIAYQ